MKMYKLPKYISCIIVQFAHNQFMQNEKDSIKKWLKDIGKDREWLASKCLLSKTSVDNWFKKVGIIPQAKLFLIQNLMNESDTKETEKEALLRRSKNSIKNVALVFTEEEWEMIKSCAKNRNTTPERYCADVIVESSYPLQKSEPNRFFCTPEKEEHLQIAKKISTPVELPFHKIEVLGNIAAGALAEGDSVSFKVKTHRPLKKGEYVVRVNGASMEPTIRDGALIVLRKYTTPPIPKPGTIVEYHDERGVTLKELSTRKTEDGKKEYILKSVNPNYPDIKPMDGGQISAVYVETLEDWKRA